MILALISISPAVFGDRRQKPQIRGKLALAPVSNNRYVWIKSERYLAG